MRYFLLPHQHIALCGRDLVVLDAKQGDYRLLAGGSDHAHWDARALVIEHEALADVLSGGGVVTPKPPAVPPTALPARPLSCALEAARPRLPLAATLAAGLEMPRLYHAGAFGDLADRARRTRAAIPGPDRCDDRLASAAAAFDRATPWIPLKGECLFRCFMLLRILRRLGYAPRWVFGVRTWPFAAHCWLQAGEVALTDRPDTLGVYTPIMAI